MTANFFQFDSLATVATALILFIALIVGKYSTTYLRGDKKRTKFLITIFFIAALLIITFAANNIFLFAISWTISNILLVSLMIHKSSWQQARNSGILALRNFIFGSSCLISALILLHLKTDSYLISEINHSDLETSSLLIPCFLILLTALSQSAIYPFKSWLINSLNSPTPASALMHAGIVNGGGIILARFAPLFFKVPELLTLAFTLGIASAIIGTFWKLIQSNVKAMLACSTMSQMGFMIAQCGMGLFPAAIAHLFWHGMFKAYLFLSSPSTWEEKRFDSDLAPTPLKFCAALICGVLGALTFAVITEVNVAQLDTTLVLIAVCFVAASQVALTIIGKSLRRNFTSAIFISTIIAALYGYSVALIEHIVAHNLLQPQPLNLWHITAVLLLLFVWLFRLFSSKDVLSKNSKTAKLYVKSLNASQPDFSTVTANRNQYKYR